MKFPSLFLLPVASLTATLAVSQVTGSVSSSIGVGGSFRGSFTTSVGQYNSPGVAGAPYYGEQVSEQVQTLADGSHITRTMPGQKMWRDSQGRTRTERQLGMTMNGAPQGPVIVDIRDPVAGFAYILDTEAKVAHRIRMQPMPARPQMAVAPTAAQLAAAQEAMKRATAARPASNVENLGTQLIEGVMAEGNRTTTTIPVGQMGNDRPMVRTNETWMSPELRVMLLAVSSDPQSGVHTQKLINISRMEPDPALFQPPVDYTVVDETGNSVTIRYGAQ